MHTAFSVRYELTVLHLHFSHQVALLSARRQTQTRHNEQDGARKKSTKISRTLLMFVQQTLQQTRKVTEILIFRPPTFFVAYTICHSSEVKTRNFKLFVPCVFSTYGVKTNWCHYFKFIHILPDLYMFWVHRSIFRGVHTAVHTNIGSVSVLLWSRALYVVLLCEQLCELSWRWTRGPETCRDPAIYE